MGIYDGVRLLAELGVSKVIALGIWIGCGLCRIGDLMGISQFIVDAGEEEEGFVVGGESALHGCERLACGDEIIEADDVLLFGDDVDREDGIHTLLGVARADIFVERDAQEQGELL